MLKVIKNKETNKWTAVLNFEGYKDTATADRPGCAIRDVLNRMQYTMGPPSDDLEISIEGW